MTSAWIWAAGLVAALLLAAALLQIGRLMRDRRNGALLAVDLPGRTSGTLRAPEYGLVGRPDAIRVLRDGRRVPVEVKSRGAPVGGPLFSHRVQVWAYCLLVESTTGASPPFGVLQYHDAEFRVPWDREARRELLALRAQARQPYDGRARPSVGRCRSCSWRESCDVRAA